MRDPEKRTTNRGNTAFFFPGQGSQYLGMGRELYYLYPAAREIYHRADRHLGFPISNVCFRGPEECLLDPGVSTLAILTTSIATFQAAKSSGFVPQLVVGHSFGIFASLVAGGTLSLEDAIDIANFRSKCIRAIAEEIPSGMLAVIGLRLRQLRNIVKKCLPDGYLDISVYNGPDYFVLSGECRALQKAKNMALAARARNVFNLSINGGIHSSLMAPVRERLNSILASYRFQTPTVPILDPCSLRCITNRRGVRSLIAREPISPIRWDRVIRFLDREEFKTSLEIGSKNVLRGILRRAGSSCSVSPIYSGQALSKLNATNMNGGVATTASTVTRNIAKILGDVSIGLITKNDALPLLGEMKRALDSQTDATAQDRILRARICEIENYIGRDGRSIPIGLLA